VRDFARKLIRWQRLHGRHDLPWQRTRDPYPMPDNLWGIPKGLIHSGEDPLEAARREFEEETGFAVDGQFLPIGEVQQKSGKIVRAWAVRGDLDADKIRSNEFEVEWPPGSGRKRSYPEIDRGAWYGLDEASRRIRPDQRPLLVALVATLRT